MNKATNKLDALGELLGVQDETTELERRGERPPAVGEILRRGVASHGAPEAPEPSTSSHLETPDDGDDSGASVTRTPHPTESARRPDRGQASRQRTSANLPVALVERLAEAKRRRWELSDVVASALEHVDLDPPQADRILNISWNQTRVQRAYQATTADIDRIDDFARRWRMNRSQVLTVILPSELDRLGVE